MGFTGFEMPCVTAHCFTWVWDIHGTDGYTVVCVVSSQICFIKTLLFG
jgi:hypothetical protein